jgi:hypothetical protein
MRLIPAEAGIQFRRFLSQPNLGTGLSLRSWPMKRATLSGTTVQRLSLTCRPGEQPQGLRRAGVQFACRAACSE